MASAPSAVAAESASAAVAVASSVPSSPASTGADGGAGGASGAGQTDDQILGLTPESLDALSSLTPETPAAEGAPKPADAAAVPAAGAAPAELSIDQFKPLFAANPQVQSLWDRYSAAQGLVARFGTSALAAKAADALEQIGGTEELAKLVEDVADVSATDAAFFGGDAKAREQLVGSFFDQDPKAVSGMLDATLAVMKQRDPNAFMGFHDKITRDVLEAEQFGPRLAMLSQALQSEDPAKLAEVVRDLVTWGQAMNLIGERKKSPEAEQVARERQSIEERERKFFEDQKEGFATGFRENVNKVMGDDISAKLKAMEVNGIKPFERMSPHVFGKLIGEIGGELDTLVHNPVLVAQVNALIARDPLKAATYKKVEDLVLTRSRSQVTKAIKNVVDRWTAGVVQQAKETQTKMGAAASRVEVGRGASGGGSTQTKVTLEKLKQGGYSTTSDDDILNA